MAADIDWINNIIEELVNPQYKLSNTILKVKLLASRVKNEKLENWVEDEINGYGENEVPEYRNLNVGLFGDLIQDRGFGNFLTNKSSALPTEHLSKDFQEVIRIMKLKNSISEFEDMSQSEEDLRMDLPFSSFTYFNQGLANGWKVNAAWRLIPKFKIQGILTKIKSKLIDFLTEISEEIGEKNNLNILKGNKQVDHIFDETIGKISGNIVNVNIGDRNLQSVNVGDHSSSNIASGKNVSQAINQDITTEIKDFIKLLSNKLDQIKLDQDDKEDLIIESNRVTTQLQREKPRVEIIQNSLRVIEGILLGVTANALTQPIIDAVAVLLSKI
jgi:hypothetical protein